MIFPSDTGTEASPSARNDDLVRFDPSNEKHLAVLEESTSGVSEDGRRPRLIDFVVINGELWTSDPRITGE